VEHLTVEQNNNKMDLKKLVEALDAKVLKGEILEAFDQFASDDVVTHSGPNDITRTKTQKMEALRWFFSNVAKVNNIRLLSCGIGQDTTHSEYVFDFTDRFGNQLVWNEIIRRRWNNGKVTEEKYYTAQFAELAQAAPKSNAKAAAPVAEKEPSAAKVQAPAAPKAPAAQKEAAPKAPAAKVEAPAKAPVAKKETPAKPDDLTLIEGIGPKIAELLHKAGIKTFAQLAVSHPQDIKAILENAGKRFQMHDPATWPQQSALARDGKTAELAILQDNLKGGRKA